MKMFVCVCTWCVCVYVKGGTLLHWELSNNSLFDGRGVAWFRSDFRASDFKKFPGGTCPQTPLAVVRLHSQQSFRPLTFKCLLLPVYINYVHQHYCIVSKNSAEKNNYARALP